VFVTTLEPCFKAYKKGFIGKLISNGQILYIPYPGTTNNIVVTAPHTFNFSTNGTLAIIPGEVFNLTTKLQVVDEKKTKR